MELADLMDLVDLVDLMDLADRHRNPPLSIYIYIYIYICCLFSGITCVAGITVVNPRIPKGGDCILEWVVINHFVVLVK